MKLPLILSFFATTLISVVTGKSVNCLFNNEVVSTVDYDTGYCEYIIPDYLPLHFTWVSKEEYNIELYYCPANNIKYFNDIKNQGRTISVPARYLYYKISSLYHIHWQKSSASNSTEALRKRFAKDVPLIKRDDVDDVLAEATASEGELVADVALEAVDASSSSSEESCSAVTSAATETVTENLTVVVTVTSCSSDICHATTVPATAEVVTTCVGTVATSYTTYCPVSSYESVQSTKVVTVYACATTCVVAAVEATPVVTYTVVGGIISEYVTYVPVTTKLEGGETIVAGAITSAGAVYAPQETVVTSADQTQTSTVYVSVAAVPSVATPETTLVAQAATEAVSTEAAVSTYEAGASSRTISILALVLIPLGYFI